MTEIIKSVKEWKSLRRHFLQEERTVGFVPTMGALHKGHESLIKKCIEENDISVVSIFVNPTQFNDPTDFNNYPKLLEKDLAVLQHNNVDYLFLPEYDEIYSDSYNFRITENSYSKILCGEFRPGHFEGVLTVVLKLLNIISPDKAYLGEKDYQQYKLIEQMCKAFFLDVEIISCPTVREEDGLAMSSRNLLLSNEQRKKAILFPKLLTSSKQTGEIKLELENLGFKVDYITDIDNRRFGAVHLGKVRLIDNVQV